MSETPRGRSDDAHDEAELALEYELDAPPEKVWRAIAIPAFRERWLPGADLAEGEPIASVPGVEIRYRMRDDGAPLGDSVVTFRVEPGLDGGTLFRIIHRMEAARGAGANDNRRTASLKGRHCERSEAIQGSIERLTISGSPRRFAPRDDGPTRMMRFALAA